MKLSKGILVSFACAALAQTDQQLDPTAQAALEQLQKALPSCAVSCLAQTVPASGCALTDTQCICTNQKLAQLSEACLGANCTVIESLRETSCHAISCSDVIELTRTHRDQTLPGQDLRHPCTKSTGQDSTDELGIVDFLHACRRCSLCHPLAVPWRRRVWRR